MVDVGAQRRALIVRGRLRGGCFPPRAQQHHGGEHGETNQSQRQDQRAELLARHHNAVGQFVGQGRRAER